MVGDAPEEPVEDLIIGHDPLSDAPGAHPGIVPIIDAVCRVNRERHKAGKPIHRSLSPEAVREATERGFLKSQNVVDVGRRRR
jgi:hypothetical protein